MTMTSRRRELEVENLAEDTADALSSELTYPQEELEPKDVEDIIVRLHIGTLRRDQLKETKESSMNNLEAETENSELDSTSGKNHGLVRRQSRISTTSTASGASDQSESSLVEAASHKKQVSEMGIQTTLGRSSSAAVELRHSEEEHHKSKKLKSKRKSSISEEENSKRHSTKHKSSSSTITLPIGYICKYMGKRETKKLWGSKHTRAAIEDIIDEISKMPKNADLPLVSLEVHYQGLSMRPHKKNKIKSFSPVMIPIQFVSYGIQDMVYPRIFCFIMVTEMSSQSRKMEVHAYACDSNNSAKTLAASLATAFKTYSASLNGGAFKFSVEFEPVSDDNNSCEV